MSSGSARVESKPTMVQASGGSRGGFANDSHYQSARRGYVTRARIAEVSSQLSERQRCVLADVARLGVVSAAQIGELHYGESASEQRLRRLDLARLCDLGVLGRLDRRIGGVRSGSAGYCYSLGVVGQRLFWPDRRRYRQPWTPGPSHLAHALGISQLYVDLRVLLGRDLQAFDTEPTCWRSFAGPGGSRQTLKPDAFVLADIGAYEDRYFVEFDNATESLTRIARKLDVYLRYWRSGREQATAGVFPRVLWVTPTEDRASRLAAAIGRVDDQASDVFAVATTVHCAVGIARGDLAAVGSGESQA